MLRIAHLYPELMNLYGDQGNLTVLQRRAAWYGEPLEIVPVNLGESIPFESVDMIFMGGGSDREQSLLTRDLAHHADQLRQVIEDGMPVLGICGAYQLMGREYITFEGEHLPGLNFFSFYTEGGADRMIGNVVLECEINGRQQTVVGFENHSGRTWLEDKTLTPWGKVRVGFGNNGKDGWEGFQYKNLIATYLHGPLLPKNPAVADLFLRKMLERKGITVSKQLDDRLEHFAHQQILNRLLPEG